VQGNTTSRQAVIVTNLRLPGQYDERLLGSVGLQGPYYNWNRWYLPGLGRYLEPDPVALVGGFNAPFGADWYGYAAQNPLRWTDATGLASCQYSISAHTMVCVGNNVSDVLQLGPDGVFSGRWFCQDNSSGVCTTLSLIGPIVPGNYNMNPDTRPGHEGFWRLEPDPPVRWWEYYSGLKRNGFELHPGGRSAGCITTNKNNQDAMKQYSAINILLWSEVGQDTLLVTQ